MNDKGRTGIVLSNDEEEIYQQVKRELHYEYYSGRLTKSEYEAKLEELERRRHGDGGIGGVDVFGWLFPERSIWDGLDLPPEKFDFYVPMTLIACSFVMFFASYVVYYYRDLPGWYGGADYLVAVMVIFAVSMDITCIASLKRWREKKRKGRYALRREVYWKTHKRSE